MLSELKTNIALFVDQDAQFSARDDIRPQTPADNELLVETLYSGVNPADVRHVVMLGIRSTVLGYDFCGRVLSAPDGSKFAKGDVVAGYTPSGIGRPVEYGTHQRRISCPDNMAFKIPPGLPESHATALAVATMTAADVIFNLFERPLPTEPAESSRPFLIWGASSRVGTCALQFARASGCRNILVTASPVRHDLLKGLGASTTPHPPLWLKSSQRWIVLGRIRSAMCLILWEWERSRRLHPWYRSAPPIRAPCSRP